MTEVFGLAMLLAIAIVVTVVALTIAVARAALNPPRHTAGYAIARGLPVDPGEAGLSFESWTLDRPDGAKIPVWEIKGRTHAHGNPALTAVFVHDWMASRIDDLATLDTWPDLVERIVLYDRRGHA